MLIGIIDLQGSVAEHENMLRNFCDVEVRLIKKPDQLEGIDGLILPGGESTTIGKLLREFELLEPLKRKIEEGLSVWGTCAGLILLAKEIVDDDTIHLGVMDIKVRRNAYGSQLDSFTCKAVIPQIDRDPIPLVFIRAPWIESVFGKAEVLAECNGRIIAARQNNMLVTSFHPELTEDKKIHEYFIKMIKDAK